MKPLRIWLVGTGTVGTWLLSVLDSQRERLAARYGLHPMVVGLASAREGFVYHPGGLDLATSQAAPYACDLRFFGRLDGTGAAGPWGTIMSKHRHLAAA